MKNKYFIETKKCSFCILFIILAAFCACDAKKSLLFTDDFESYRTGETPSSPWIKSGGGKVFVDTEKSHSGKKSVHFISGEQYKNRAFIGLFDKSVFPLRKNRYYGSMFMWIDTASPDGVHWTMLQSSGKVKGKNFSSEIRYGGQHQKRLMANYETNTVKSDCWQHSTVAIPEKRWFKVEWFFDGEKNLMKFWLDDKPLEEITVKERGSGCISNDLNGEWLFPVFENVQIGWVDYQPNGGERNIWIDDFKISSKPLK